MKGRNNCKYKHWSFFLPDIQIAKMFSNFTLRTGSKTGDLEQEAHFCELRNSLKQLTVLFF